MEAFGDQATTKPDIRRIHLQIYINSHSWDQGARLGPLRDSYATLSYCQLHVVDEQGVVGWNN